MATLDDAQWVARRRVISDSLRTGKTWRGWVEEFAEGFLIWTTPPAGELPAVGDGAKMVLDRQTGDLSHWPALSSPDVIAAYRARTPVRPAAAPRTVDASAVLAADRRLVPAPNVLVRVVDPAGGVREAHGCKAEVPLRHHDLVEQWLTEQPAGTLDRGARRQAELIALSDLLYELDFLRAAAGRPSLDVVTAREELAAYQFTAHRVGPPGDPKHGAARAPGDTSLRAWVRFGLASEAALALAEPIEPGSAGESPQPGRFPPDVAAALVDGGWGEQRLLSNGERFVPQTWAHYALQALGEAMNGRHRIAPSAAARQAITEFPVVSVSVKGPGQAYWVSPFTLAVSEDLGNYADVLGDFAEVIDAPLVPIGVEEGGGLIAIDALGRVFVLDQTGEYCYGMDLDSALVALVRGAEPVRVTW